MENLKKLSRCADIIVRIPVIGGYNDNREEMKKAAEFLHGLGIKKVELLPYHAMGENKYDAIGMKCEKFHVPGNVEDLKKLFWSEENV